MKRKAGPSDPTGAGQGHQPPRPKRIKVSSSQQFEANLASLSGRLSSSHRAELEHIWSLDRRMPSLASRKSWSLVRGIDPKYVHAWFSRKRYNTARKTGEIMPKGTYELDSKASKSTSKENQPPSPLHKNVNLAEVKIERERIASPPSLLPPSVVTSLTRPLKQNKKKTHGAQVVKHTRAHISAPHPRCFVCNQAFAQSNGTSSEEEAKVTPKTYSPTPELVLGQPSSDFDFEVATPSPENEDVQSNPGLSSVPLKHRDPLANRYVETTTAHLGLSTTSEARITPRSSEQTIGAYTQSTSTLPTSPNDAHTSHSTTINTQQVNLTLPSSYLRLSILSEELSSTTPLKAGALTSARDSALSPPSQRSSKPLAPAEYVSLNVMLPSTSTLAAAPVPARSKSHARDAYTQLNSAEESSPLKQILSTHEHTMPFESAYELSSPPTIDPADVVNAVPRRYSVRPSTPSTGVSRVLQTPGSPNVNRSEETLSVHKGIHDQTTVASRAQKIVAFQATTPIIKSEIVDIPLTVETTTRPDGKENIPPSEMAKIEVKSEATHILLAKGKRKHTGTGPKRDAAQNGQRRILRRVSRVILLDPAITKPSTTPLASKSGAAQLSSQKTPSKRRGKRRALPAEGSDALAGKIPSLLDGILSSVLSSKDKSTLLSDGTSDTLVDSLPPSSENEKDSDMFGPPRTFAYQDSDLDMMKEVPWDEQYDGGSDSWVLSAIPWLACSDGFGEVGVE